MSSKGPKKNQKAMVELKARVDDLTHIRNKLMHDGAEKIGVFHQKDTYYNVPKGRLKLRKVEGRIGAELIYYERENVAGPKRSSVLILSIPQPEHFKQILERIMEVNAIVDKVREIYFYDGVQVHLDIVKDLGTFVEFERTTSQDKEKQKNDLRKLETLRERLGINPQSLQRLSYSELS